MSSILWKIRQRENLEEEEIVDALGNDGNMSMPEQVNRPNAWRKIMMMIKQRLCSMS
jgi:hypothetical protein